MEHCNVTIIIPVGPGHENIYRNAVWSAAMQGDVEIIVVNDSGRELAPITGIDIRYMECDARNPSVGRNMAAKVANGDALIFLDSDDALCPDAVNVLTKAYLEGDGQYGIIYGNVIRSDTGELHISPPQYCGPDLHKTALFTPKRMPTHLVGKELFLNLGGFDETLDLWEDVELEIREDVAGVCALHINNPVYWYNFNGGRRRIDPAEGPKKEIRDKYSSYYRGEKMACGTCGSSAVAKGPVVPVNNDTYQALSRKLNDGDQAYLVYIGTNTAVTRFVGPQSGRNYRFGKTVATRTRKVRIGRGDDDVLPEDAAIMVKMSARNIGSLFTIEYEKRIEPPPIPQTLRTVKATPTKQPAGADIATKAAVYAGMPVSRFTPAELLEAVNLVDESILRGWLAEANGVAADIINNKLESLKPVEEVPSVTSMSLAQLRTAVQNASQEEIKTWYKQEDESVKPRRGALNLLKGYMDA